MGEVCGKHVADRELNVTEAAVPCAPRSRLLRPDRNQDFVPRPLLEAVLVHEVVGGCLGAVELEVTGPDGLVLRERFLGGERAREVHVATRPLRISAERPQVLDDKLDLGVGKRVLPFRHMAVHATLRAAAVHDRVPGTERLRRVARTIAEVGELMAVRQRHREPDEALRRAAAVERVAGGARQPVDIRSRRVRRQCVLQRRRRRRRVLRRVE